MLRAVAILMIAALAAAGKTSERHVPWEQIPSDLVGQQVRVVRSANGSVSGRLVRVETQGLVVESRGAERSLSKGEVIRIETTRRKSAKWAIIGAAIGAGATAPLLAIADISRRNEGGINSGRNLGIAAAIVAAAGAAGYFAGRGADTDRTVIHVVTK